MSAFERNKTGITVHVVDLAPVIKVIVPQCRTKGFELNSFGLKWGYAKNSQGVFALNNVGVGSRTPLTSHNPLKIYLAAHKIGSKTWYIGEGVFVTMKLEELLALPVTAEIDLADFIDRGGGRLHFNFMGWEEALRKANRPESSDEE
jgi:hypothetical protein